MDRVTLEFALFAASAVSALIAASAKARARILPRVEKLALAVCLAASAFALTLAGKLS